MFKNLKQKVSSDQKVRTPQSAGRNVTPNSTPTGRSAISRLPRPSTSTPVVGRRINSDNTSENGSLDSPDIVQQFGDASGDAASNPSKNNMNETISAENTPVTDKKIPFFKRLEFLTPLKDQVANKLSESKESISSLVDEVRGSVTGKTSADTSKPDVVAQINDRSRNDSISDTEEMMSHVDVSAIPKEQLFAKVMRLEKMLLKYREKYSELASSHRDAKREREKIQSVMQQTQDKSLRRIQELKEAAALDLKAKMHLEEEFRVSLEEKEQLIHVMQTQIAILKDDAPKSPTIQMEGTQHSEDDESDLQNKIKNLEEQLKFANDTCEGLRHQGDALQLQLSERLEEIEKLNEVNLTEKSKLIKQLREAKNVIEHIEEDRQTAVAEAKRQMHVVLESKDNEMGSLHDQVKRLHIDLEEFKMKKEERENSLMEELQNAVTAGRTIESKLVDASAENDEFKKEIEEKIQRDEENFNSEIKNYVSELSNAKAECLKLSGELQSALDSHKKELDTLKKTHQLAVLDQSKNNKMKLDEKDNQMRLAIEERELNKMAAVSQQDTEAQNLLKQLDSELENVRQKVADLETERQDEATKHLDEISNLKDTIVKSEEEQVILLQNLEKDQQHHMSSKAQEFLEKFTSQKKKYEDKLHAREAFWTKKIEESEQCFAKEIQDIKVHRESEGKERNELFQQQADKVLSLEKEIAALNSDRETLTKKISEMDRRLQEKAAQSNLSQFQLQERLGEVESEKERQLDSKDVVIKDLGEKIECLEKELTEREHDILQKSDASHTEVETLQKNMENMKSQKENLEKSLEALNEKLQRKVEAMKTHILEMEENHKEALSRLASQLENQQQESAAMLTDIEKEKLEIQKSFAATNEKFLEAGGRLKSLAHKYKTTVNQHQVAVQEKDAIISKREATLKEMQERITDLEQQASKIETEKDALLKKIESDLAEKLSNEKQELENNFFKEMNELKKSHAEDKESLKIDLEKAFDEKQIILIGEMSSKQEKEKENLVNETKRNFDVEMRNLELKLQSETSNATDKEKSLLQSLHDAQQKLTECEKLLSEKNQALVSANENLKSLQTEMEANNKNLQIHISDFEILKEQYQQCKMNSANLEETASNKDIELDEKEKQLAVISAELKEIKDAKILNRNEIGILSDQSAKLTAELLSKNSELDKLRQEIQTQSNMLEKNQSLMLAEQECNQKLKAQCDEQCDEIKNLATAHALYLVESSDESKAKLLELESKAKQKIAQQQIYIKNAKGELTSQLETIRKLSEEKEFAVNLIDEMKLSLQSVQAGKANCIEVINKMQQKDDKFAEQLKLVEDLTKEAADVEKMKNETIEILQTQLQDSNDSETEYQSLVKTMRSKILENEERTKSLEAMIEDKKSKVKEVEELNAKQSENLQIQAEEKDSERELSSNLKLQFEKLTEDFEATKNNEIEKHASLQLTQAENDSLVNSLQKLKTEFAEKEANLQEQMTGLQVKLNKEIENATARLEEESQKKVSDLKKKAETRLAQIKKTFTSQVEEKLKMISQLEDQKLELEEKLKSSSENADGKSEEATTIIEKLQLELDTVKEEYANSLAEKEKMHESWVKEKEEIFTKNVEESEKRIENLLEEERVKYEDEQLQLAEVKDRLEQVLQEARLNLEETEKKMDEEKDRADLALQDEKDRRVQSESCLAVAQEDFTRTETEWNQKNVELSANILSLEDSLKNKNMDLVTAKSNATVQASEMESQLEAARKRSEKLEKDREAVKQNLSDANEEHERQLQSLRNEVNSAKKQVDVLSKMAVEDKDVEVERKLGSLKEDFDRRLREKDGETTQKIKRMMIDYESQIHRNSENYESKLEKMKQKNLSNADVLRSDHHKELVFLQREIQSREKKIEETIEKYEAEMHEMEKNMSEQVDKSMYRAMTSEKKLQDNNHEHENETLRNQLKEIKIIHSETQQREHENAKMLQTLEARVSLATPLADPDKLEYLRKILFQYIMGNEQTTMAKVIILLLQYSDLESQQILEKHGIPQT